LILFELFVERNLLPITENHRIFSFGFISKSLSEKRIHAHYKNKKLIITIVIEGSLSIITVIFTSNKVNGFSKKNVTFILKGN